jgi:hypothetical protein
MARSAPPPAFDRALVQAAEPLDLDAWLEATGLRVSREKPFAAGGRLLELAACPFNENHRGSAFLIVFAEGGIAFRCHHGSCQDSCGGKGWGDVLRLYAEVAAPEGAALGIGQPAVTRRMTAADMLADLRALTVQEDGEASAAPKGELEDRALTWAEDAAALDGLSLLKLESGLAALGCRASFVRRWSSEVKSLKRQLRKAADAIRPPKHDPYSVEDGCLIYYTDLGERRVVSDFVPEIVEHTVDEQGNRGFSIQAETADGRTFLTDVTTGVFTNMPALMTAFYNTGGQVTVYPGQETRLRSAITLRGQPDVPQVALYRRTGWVETADGPIFLIPGLESPGVRLELPAQLPFRLPAGAELTKGLDALDGLFQAFPPAMTAIPLALILGMPLAFLAGWRRDRYGVFIVAQTGNLKTAWSSAAMCLWGDFRDTSAILKWGQGFTLNGALQLASRCHDMVLAVDNYKPSTGDGERGLINFTHAAFEGSDKLRLNRDSTMRLTDAIHCGVLINGEDAPHSDSATLARYIVVPFSWPAGQANAQLARAQAAALHLPAVSRIWLEWLLTAQGRHAAAWAGKQYPGVRDQWLQNIHDYENKAVNAGRLASNLAINQLSLLVASEHPQLGPVIKPYLGPHAEGLRQVATDMSTGVKELREGERVMHALREMVATGRAQLAPKGGVLNDRPERMLGWKNDSTGDVYLLPGAVRHLAEEYLGRGALGDVSDQKLHKQFSDMGLLAGHEEGRFTVRIPGKGRDMLRVLHLREDALSDPGPGSAN